MLDSTQGVEGREGLTPPLQQHRKRRVSASLEKKTTETGEMAQQDPPRVELRDYANPIFNSKRTGLVPPTITNAFELKPALVNMVSNNQFSGHPSEDPHLHLKTFIELCETFKMNGVTEDAIRLRLFPFSLRDKAKLWLYSLDATNINTWDGLTKAFLNKPSN